MGVDPQPPISSSAPPSTTRSTRPKESRMFLRNWRTSLFWSWTARFCRSSAWELPCRFEGYSAAWLPRSDTAVPRQFPNTRVSFSTMPLKNLLSLVWRSPNNSTTSSKTGEQWPIIQFHSHRQQRWTWLPVQIRKIKKKTSSGLRLPTRNNNPWKILRREVIWTSWWYYHRIVQRSGLLTQRTSFQIGQRQQIFDRMIETSLERCTEDLRQEVMKMLFSVVANRCWRG